MVVKNSLAPEPVGQPAEAERADDRAGEIGAAGETDVGVGEVQRRARLQRAGDRAGERHFEPVENPGDAERDDDEDVEPSPRQALEPGRDEGFDDIVASPLFAVRRTSWRREVAIRRHLRRIPTRLRRSTRKDRL